ncbi:uncharacterized protein LOC144203300 [Stigmatopora nigra]
MSDYISEASAPKWMEDHNKLGCAIRMILQTYFTYFTTREQMECEGGSRQSGRKSILGQQLIVLGHMRASKVKFNASSGCLVFALWAFTNIRSQTHPSPQTYPHTHPHKHILSNIDAMYGCKTSV